MLTSPEFMTNERDLTLDRLYSTIEEILSSSMEYSDICHQVEPGVAIWGEGPQRFAVSDTRGCRRPTEIAHFLQQLHGKNVWPGRVISGKAKTSKVSSMPCAISSHTEPITGEVVCQDRDSIRIAAAYELSSEKRWDHSWGT